VLLPAGGCCWTILCLCRAGWPAQRVVPARNLQRCGATTPLDMQADPALLQQQPAAQPDPGAATCCRGCCRRQLQGCNVPTSLALLSRSAVGGLPLQLLDQAAHLRWPCIRGLRAFSGMRRQSSALMPATRRPRYRPGRACRMCGFSARRRWRSAGAWQLVLWATWVNPEPAP